MGVMPPFAIVALVLILGRVITELWLSRLNQRHVRAHANDMPDAFRAVVDEATYRRSVDYTLARGRFGDLANLFDAVLVVVLLFSGVLPWTFGRLSQTFGSSIWAMAACAVARLSIAGAGVETDRVGRRNLVDLGRRGRDCVSISSAARYAGSHHAAFQQVYTPIRRNVARPPVCIGAAHRFSHTQHRGNGWQQTLSPFQCLFHGLRTFSENRPVRHAASAAHRA